MPRLLKRSKMLRLTVFLYFDSLRLTGVSCSHNQYFDLLKPLPQYLRMGLTKLKYRNIFSPPRVSPPLLFVLYLPPLVNESEQSLFDIYETDL